MNRYKTIVSLGIMIVLVAGCGLAPMPDTQLGGAYRRAKGAPVPHAGYVEVSGEIGPGALYSLRRPDVWNGDLVLYAHGYVNPALPVMLPDQIPSELQITKVFDLLLSQGYAVAFSSYSENGWAIKDGITRTRQLKGLFKSNFGKPDQTYLIGSSMGGLIAVAIAEKHSQLVDGVLALCGPVGGSSFQFEHLVHVRALFDVFYDGALPGDVYTQPPDLVWDDAMAAYLTGVIEANPFGALLLSTVTPPRIVWDTPEELGESIVTALAFNIMGTQDVLDKTHGHIPVGNRDTVYTSSPPLVDTDWLNAVVDRFDSTPDAENVMGHWYEPTGALRVPVVTLHTKRDPAVPYAHEAAFEAAVMNADRGDLLYPLSTETFGHCTFTDIEFIRAWTTLLTAVGP